MIRAPRQVCGTTRAVLFWGGSESVWDVVTALRSHRRAPRPRRFKSLTRGAFLKHLQGFISSSHVTFCCCMMSSVRVIWELVIRSVNPCVPVWHIIEKSVQSTKLDPDWIFCHFLGDLKVQRFLSYS